MNDGITTTGSNASAAGQHPAALTETGKLPVGIIVDGVRHQDFELRPPTIGDNVDASLEASTSSALEVGAGIFARQLLRLGSLPPEKIDTSLMLQLNPLDYNEIDRVDGELRKKVMRDGQGLVGGPPVARPSPATE